VRKCIKFKQVYPIANASHHSGGSARIIIGNPSKNTIEIVFRGSADDDFHTP
jgi:hypothetical protein